MTLPAELTAPAATAFAPAEPMKATVSMLGCAEAGSTIRTTLRMRSKTTYADLSGPTVMATGRKSPPRIVSVERYLKVPDAASQRARMTAEEFAAASGTSASSSPLPADCGVGSRRAGAPGFWGPFCAAPDVPPRQVAVSMPPAVPLPSVTRQNPLSASETQRRPAGSTRRPPSAVSPCAMP